MLRPLGKGKQPLFNKSPQLCKQAKHEQWQYHNYQCRVYTVGLQYLSFTSFTTKIHNIMHCMMKVSMDINGYQCTSMVLWLFSRKRSTTNRISFYVPNLWGPEGSKIIQNPESQSSCGIPMALYHPESLHVCFFFVGGGGLRDEQKMIFSSGWTNLGSLAAFFCEIHSLACICPCWTSRQAYSNRF